MLKPSTLILFFSLLCCSFGWAQTVEWSNQQKLKSKTNYTRIIGENASGLYVLRGKSGELNRDVVIEKYKHNLAQDATRDIDQQSNSFIEKVFLQEDGLLWVATKRNDSVPKIDVYASKMNNQLVPLGNNKLLAQIESSTFKSNTEIYFQPSMNKSHYALMYFTDGSDRNSCVLNLHGYNEALSQDYTRTFTIPYPTSDIVVTGFECDNEGNAYLLVDYPKANDRKKKDKQQREFYLYAYYKQLDKTLEYEIHQDSTYINDIGLAINNGNQTVHVAGFYALANDKTVEGTFMYSVDAASTLLKNKSYEPLNKSFTNRVITTMLNETGNQLTELYLRKLIPRSDGGITLVAEKYYETRQTYTYYQNGFPQTASRITYNYDEILVFSKSATGKTQFNELIKKSQSSMNDAGYYSSFVLLNTPDKLAFVYNSNVNEDGDIMMSSLNPLGQIETKILIKSMSYYVQLMPAESKQIGATSTVISTLKDRRFTLMKLTL